jgi:hypothetical protein
MPCDQVHRRGVPFAAPFAAQTLQQGLESDVASTLDQQPHGQARGPSATLKLDHAVGPVREAMLDAEEGRVHAVAWP